MAKYNPPEQAKALQWLDIVVIIGAIFMALWFPLYMGWAGNTKVVEKIENPTWETAETNAGSSRAMGQAWLC